MTKGLPASGKTSWAKALLASSPTGSHTRVNKDDLRDMMHAGQWSKNNEKVVLATRDAIIEAALEAGQHVIVDDTNFGPKHENRLRDLAKKHGARFELVDFTDVPLDEVLARNFARTDKQPVPEKVIRDMHARYLAPLTQRPTYDQQLPPCVIVDIDGTLAHMTGRGPYDWQRVAEDAVDAMVARVVRQFHSDFAVVLLSGRDGSCRDDTVKWLADHDIPYDVFAMREPGDMRKDSVVKRELFDRYVLGTYYPALVIDDRTQVVRMWRDELGLTVWQVADGDF